MALILKTLCWCNNGNVNAGSLNIRKDYDTPTPPNCGVSAHPNSFTGVFVPNSLGSNFQLTATLENDGDDVIEATLKAEQTSGTPLFGDINFVSAPFPAHSDTTVSATVNTAYMKLGDKPNCLQKFNITLQWSYSIPLVGDTHIVNTKLTVYLLPGIPINTYGTGANLWDTAPAPYNNGNTHYIWTDLLDACCDACDLYETILGRRPKTREEHIQAFVYELNQSGVFQYDIWNGLSAYTLQTPALDNTVKLKKYLLDRKKTYPCYLNCTDCGSLVAMDALACGFTAYTAVMANPTAPTKGFACNPIIAIGYTDWEKPFKWGFSYHEVAVTQDTCDKDTPIYDACLQLDSGDCPSSAGPAGKSPVLPQGTLFAETTSDGVKVPIGTAYTKDIYRERLVADGQDCNIIGTSYCVTDFIPDLSMPISVPKNWDALRPVMRRYGLTDNPLPQREGEAVSLDALTGLPGLAQLGTWTLTEDYGRHRVYRLEQETQSLEVSFWAGQSSEEAWLFLLTRLAVISHPDVHSVDFADCAFGISRHWRIFAVRNLLVEVSSFGVNAVSSAEAIFEALKR